MEIPVVFVHGEPLPGRKGKQEYIGVALRQAGRFNERVVLLGVESNRHLEAEWLPLADYFEGAEWLAEHYVHMSTNSAGFEVAAGQCAPVLREFMLSEELEVVALCETDTMLYCRMGDVAEELGEFTAAFAIPQNQPEYRWSASFHASIWTREGIEGLCEVQERGYSTEGGLERIRSKWDHHRREKLAGGVCIMTFLWFLSQEMGGVINLSRVRDGSVFDHNVRVAENCGPEDFEMEAVEGYPRPIKKVVWQNGLPYGYHLPSDRLVRFNALHFNSSSKKLMVSYQTGEKARSD